MEFNRPQLKELARSLPEHFDFYHLGNVEARHADSDPAFLTDSTLLDEKRCVAFRIFGELESMLLVFFDQGLDAATYTEMGNIIASQLATRASRDGSVFMISPPREIRPRRLAKAWTGSSTVHRRYSHFYQDKQVVLDVLLIPTQESEVTGNA